MAQDKVGFFMERPEQVPEEVWGWLPAFPFEYSGICAILPLPRVILDKFCKPPAEFQISDLVISPTVVNPGQVVTLSCKVTNMTYKAGVYTVKLGGDFMAEQTVSLAPGESKVASFEVVPDVARTYSVTVDGLAGTFKATTAPVADIRVEILTIEPAEVQVGQPVSISVRATNYGTAAGTKKIMCTVT